jgi:hypothetical protein
VPPRLRRLALGDWSARRSRLRGGANALTTHHLKAEMIDGPNGRGP